ncbi:MAG: hypothetical protein JJ959_06720 [Nisaea sp.]|jgi:hypothetical protein|uniref:hypothetical protein n=1 Tax=Nisaea sp. TaxID=2024842 RepID=UPI001B229C2C|nr:hypothetical protein [Nisaea sp.]MBO6560212.1 hypothetical protein [Nisaea sp.]
MHLTDIEHARADGAKLELILANIYAAIKANDIAKFDTHREALQNFIVNGNTHPDIAQRANDALLEIGTGITASSLAMMAEQADRMVIAGAGLKAAIEVLESGKAELFFPTLASASKRLADLFATLKEAADEIGGDITDVDGLGDLPDLIGEIADKGQTVLDKLKNADKA